GIDFPECSILMNLATPSLSNGKFRIKMPESARYSLQVFSTSGKLIKSMKFNNSETDLDISDCFNGVYILIIADSNKKYTQKLIKL
ncbi:T9SS type A sorting domain-containing protein, partial [bacterium]|nr:T9SS type A sorting domain-containing protein [bacterium]